MVYVVSPCVTSFDSRWAIAGAISLERHGDVTLDEYSDLIASEQFYSTEVTQGHLRSMYPAGVHVVAAPFVLIADWVYRARGIDLEASARRDIPRQLEKIVASLFTAATAALVYLLARESLPMAHSLLCAGTFALATSAWSTLSRGLWQHTPSVLAITCALYCAVTSSRHPRRAAWIGLCVGIAYAVRPSNAAAIVAFTLWVAWQRRAQLPRYLALLAVPLVPLVLHSFWVYGTALSPYYRQKYMALNDAPWEALAGNLLSPARGLLVYSPVFLLALAGVYHLWRTRRFGALHGLAAVLIIAQWVGISMWHPWWGGHSYGPRLMSDALPYLMLLLIPVFGLLGRQRPALTTAFVLLVLPSVILHARGAGDAQVWEWNSKPVNVDMAPERMWDWRDAQFARGAIRVPQPLLPSLGTPILLSPTMASGRTQTFRLAHPHGQGWPHVQEALLLINDRLDGGNGCFVRFDPATHSTLR